MTVRKFQNHQEAKLYIELHKLFKKQITSNVRDIMASYPDLSKCDKDTIYEMAFKDYFEQRRETLF